MAGLPTPELLLLLERCCTAGRAGRMGGGRSCAPASRADSAGLKVVIISAVELLLRRMAASGSRMRMVCRGLAGSELAAPSGGFFRSSSVSSTTSGACLAVFCRSSSRSSFSAVLMVFSMSCQRHRHKEVSAAASRPPPVPCPVCQGGGTPTLESLSAKRELREKTKPTLWQHRGARWLRCQWEFGHQLQKHQISRDTDTNPGTYSTLPPSGTGHLSRPPNLQPPTGVRDLCYPRAGHDAGRSRAVAERHSDVHRVSGMKGSGLGEAAPGTPHRTGAAGPHLPPASPAGTRAPHSQHLPAARLMASPGLPKEICQTGSPSQWKM